MVGVPLVFLRHPPEPVQAVTACGAVVLLLLGVRMRFVGVFVNDQGVKFSLTMNDEIVPWAQIAAFEPRRATIAQWLFEPGLSLWILAPDGSVRETPLIRSSVWMIKQRMGRRTTPAPGFYLAEPAFDEVLRRLRQELAERSTAAD